MRKDIELGVIGLGMGKHVLRVNHDATSRMIVRGICDLDERKLSDHAREHDIELATTHYEALLERDDIQVVGIYSPDHLHADQILAALAAGKHVVVTKPMVNSMAEAEQVIAAVRRSGKTLLVAQTQRYRPENMATKRLLDAGEIGDVVFVQTGYVHDMRPVLATPGRDWRRDPAKKDWLVGAACHAIDLALWFGGNVDTVSAYANDGNVLPDREGGNNFLINLTFQNGAVGRVLALFSAVRPPPGLSTISVCGTRGSVVGSRVSRDGPDGVEESELPVEDSAGGGHASETTRILRHMERCIIGEECPEVSAVQAARTLAVAIAAKESIRTGKSVRPRMAF
ncbi:MAG: Gfo/Idh/MocA family oxidoreductase [Lentisphaerae bacterium]|jgi:predicted dehydrogenase|nr:Gfo/Idh/MocA family oxidoreductase [Lentisphaerota bacterium]MBT4816839.1 Gfo/Idh/MocA family oxidoreductase [Lentisphaerota bacterium]MBT5611101.1 Gfo/Idh/MocA family oxidoreductase [Lentisphaerota bacterium]MBT7055643.1 Gfo/Idh/MocA family oxidoreductase [Lentisphaerota bacterium]MBT7846590.1 Gfo/Idh/MocA family oxidoreductase [Lentisphaerota bacterium]